VRLLKTFFISFVCAAALALGGCASLTGDENPSAVDSQWISPALQPAQRTIPGLLVASFSSNPTDRRVFEDMVCNTFAFRGIPATPSYTLIPNPQDLTASSGIPNIPLLQNAAAKTHAGDILIVRSLGVKTNVIYNPGITWGPGPWFGPGPGFGPAPGFGPGPFFAPPAAWNNVWAIPPSITQEQISRNSVELISAESGAVLWSANTSTVLGQMPLAGTIENYAELLFSAITHAGFLAPQSPVTLPAPASAVK
jgi:hypothetical protein